MPFWKKTQPNSEAAPPRDKPSGGSWLDAVRAYDDRMLRQAAQTRNWRRGFGLSMVLNFCSLGVVVYAIHMPKFIQVPIAIDKLGQSAVVTSAAPGAALRDKQEYAEVGNFIENCRTVLVDKMGQRRLQERCYSRLPDDSAARQWYMDHTRGSASPDVLGETHSVEPTILSELKISANTWEVEWSEQAINLDGSKMGPPIRYKAHLTDEFITGANSMKLLRMNPNGFYVQRWTWTQEAN